MDQAVQVFLCYAHQDEEIVKDIYTKLTKTGFKPWMDIYDLAGGVIWKTAIEKAIQKSHFFFACISKNSINKRGFVQREINTALDVLMELSPENIFLIPLRLEECDVPERISQYQWIDYFRDDGWNRLINSVYKGLDELGMVTPVKLRTSSITKFEEHQVEKMIKEFGFTDLRKNRYSKGIKHNYELIERRNGKLVLDHTTKLIWQQSGSDNHMTFSDAKDYIRKINEEFFGEHKEWRLPTLEEAMSLMEFEPLNDNLYINPIFEKKQWGIWTIDTESNENVWTVDFDYGFCGHYPCTNTNFVRAVLP